MKKLLILIMVSFYGYLVSSQELLTTSNYPFANIGVGSTILAEDPLTNAGSLVNFNLDRRFRLELVYNRNSHSDLIISTKWRLTVTAMNTVTSQQESLVIDFTPSGASNYSAWADFKSSVLGANTMTWRITGINVEKKDLSNVWVPGTVSDLPIADIHLEAMVFNDRIVEMSSTALPKMSLTSGNELNWDHVTGAVEYDVEWVHIDLQDQFTYSASVPQGPFEFKEPVRITTYKHQHVLDLIYPKGTIYYRIRAKGYFFRVSGVKEVYYYGGWSYGKKSGAGNMSLAISTNFEGKKNWQYQVGYSENGLSASTMTYYDGSLRARQQLTQQKSTGQVVAASSLYDYEGRSSVQVIPTPINGNSLNYYTNLHQDASGGAFDKTDFDQGISPAMGSASGAAQYYSPSNNLWSDPYRDRVPDAEGYPYSQVISTNDNLGRLRVSGGVGKTHRIGGGHEKHFYYVKPTERDLRELFGSNVGDLSHYNKQIVIDENGQASVIYSDQNNRTIATGLMGEAPTNLLPLDNNPAGAEVTTTSTLMPMNLITTDDDGNFQSEVDYKHFNQGTSTITLKYDLLEGGVNAINEYFGGSCASCFYELEIKVFDPYGAPVNLNYTSTSFPGTPLSTIKERYSGSDLDCQSPTFNSTLPGAISYSLALSMQGEYRIQKILRVDKAALLNFMQNEAPVLPGAPNLNDYLDTYTSNVITMGCGLDCASYYEQECREQLGIPLTGTLSSLSVSDQNIINECISIKCAESTSTVLEEEMQEDPGMCNMMLGLFKQDISPGGWVFESYMPWRITTSYWQISYPLPSGGTFTPTSLQDLSDHWRSEWVDLIAIESHPEHCHYLKCVSLAAAKQYPFTVNLTTTFLDAQPEYINSSGDLVMSTDPLIYHPLYSSSFSSFLSGLNSNYNTTGVSLYDFVTNQMPLLTPTLFNDANGIPLVLGTTEYKDRVWMYMRNLYIGEREEFIENGYSSTCLYLDNPNANVPNPLSITTSGGQTNVMSLMDDNCAQSCENNVVFWMSEIEENCNDLDESELNQVRYHLKNYCLNNCDGYSNQFGAIQMSDIIAGNSDLLAVEGILSSNCPNYFTLGSMAVDDTCQNPTTVTYTGVTVFGPTLNKNLALLTTLVGDVPFSSTHYTNFITSPGIASIASDFSYGHWTSSAMKVRLINNSTLFFVEYIINDIANIEILSYDLDPNPFSLNPILFNVKVTLVNGTSSVHAINYYTLKSQLDTDLAISTYCICELKATTISFDYCEPVDPSLDSNFSFEAWVDDCIQDILDEANILGTIAYAEAYEDFMNGLIQSFSTNCFNNTTESFSISYDKQEYYYTLYYYDQAANLVQTVPPAGVHIVIPQAFNADGVWNGTTEPLHDLKSIYTFNSLNQVTKVSTPDGGVSRIWYNSVQQPRYSQTAEQAEATKCTYISYDALGRAIEGGVIANVNMSIAIGSKDVNTYPIATSGAPTYDVTKTIYNKQTVPLNTALGWNPKDLNNQIAASLSYRVYTGTIQSYDNAIYYDYDPHGNPKEILNDIPLMGANNRYKRVEYQYEVYSGKVLKLIYQKDKEDQFIHSYQYDDDNRLTQVQTSRDGVKWDTDASYSYYLHGPLARVELGEDKVQGIDYAYTVHGWLKGVNSNSGVATRDLGRDGGILPHKNRYVAQDEIGYSLTYFNSGTETDYKPIVTPTAANNWLSANENAILTGAPNVVNLYNGNIRAMFTSIMKLNNQVLGNVARVYKYDQLQRIKEAQTYTAVNQVANNSWTGAGATSAHYSSYSYDLNGNLKTLNRKNNLGATIDDFTYRYELSGGIAGDLKSNRLYHINDGQTINTAFNDDVDDMGNYSTTNVNSTNNYRYDASGRLTQDLQEKISTIEWNVQNKLTKLTRFNTSDDEDLEFRYDALGRRVVKISKPKVLSGGVYVVNATQIKTTYYALDAQGNVMATYFQQGDVAGAFATSGLNTTAMKLVDFQLYGSSRLGIRKEDKTLSTLPNTAYLESSNRATAIINVSATTYGTTGTTTYVQYKIGGIDLNDVYAWNNNVSLFDANVKGLVEAINKRTFFTDVSASLWHDKNAAGVVYIKLSFSQPGIWGNQSLSVCTTTTLGGTPAPNNSLTTGPHVARQFGYGTSKGSVVFGNKLYELSNYLGNVLAMVSDRKWGVDDGVYNLTTGVKTSSIADKITDYYVPTVLSYTDYDPFGTEQSGRNDGDYYRFGFNGYEGDKEVSGEGNSYTTEFRQYDPRIGRWKSLDPMSASSPYLSPYCAYDNNPIYFTDPQGLTAENTGGKKKKEKEKKLNLEGGERVTLPRGAKVTRFRDADKNGIIGHSNGVAYKGVKKNDIFQFEQEGVTYTAMFDASGNFKNYKGSDGSVHIGEVIIWKQVQRIIATTKTYNDLFGNESFMIEQMVHLRATEILKTKVSMFTFGYRVPVENQNYRILKVFGKNTKYVKVFGAVKIIGGVASVVSPFVTGFEMYDKWSDGNPNTYIEGRDVMDLGVGIVGGTTTVLVALGYVTNPVGWVIGIGCGVYGLVTFIIDDYNAPPSLRGVLPEAPSDWKNQIDNTGLQLETTLHE